MIKITTYIIKLHQSNNKTFFKGKRKDTPICCGKNKHTLVYVFMHIVTFT